MMSARMNPISTNRHIRFGVSRLFGNITVHAVLVVFVIISLFPIYLMFNASLKTSRELFQSIVAPPGDPQWHNFHLIFVERAYYKNMINSLIFAGSTTVIAVTLSVLAGYGFAAFKFVGKQTLFVIVLIGLMVSETSVLIPVYNLLQDLDLLNTRIGLILPQTALGLAFGVFLMTTFFKEIPRSVIEAGIIDGCSDLQLLRHVIVPLARPSIMSLTLIEFMWAWNSFFFPDRKSVV